MFGFSLVEVTIAIGLIAFSLVAITGLFAIGLNNGTESADDTHLALMVRQVNAWSRSQSFSTLTSNQSHLLFYDSAGALISDTDGTPADATTAATAAAYSCTIQLIGSTVSNDFVYLQLLFEWPLSAPASARQQRVVITSRSNED